VLVGRDPHTHLLYRDVASLQYATAMSRYPDRTFVVLCHSTLALVGWGARMSGSGAMSIR
jgi:hypothetical protein